MKEVIFNFLVYLDKFINRYFLFGEWETISLRASRSRNEYKIAEIVCKITDIFDEDHCNKMLITEKDKEVVDK